MFYTIPGCVEMKLAIVLLFSVLDVNSKHGPVEHDECCAEGDISASREDDFGRVPGIRTCYCHSALRDSVIVLSVHVASIRVGLSNMASRSCKHCSNAAHYHNRLSPPASILLVYSIFTLSVASTCLKISM